MDFDTDPLCVIGSDLTLSGKVESAKDLVIYGRVEGIVVSKGRVNISETGIVEGIVSGEKIFIAGHARGKVMAQTSLKITRTAEVVAKLEAKELFIEDGARVNYRVHQNSKSDSLSGNDQIGRLW